jgi:hypothetical protein
MGTYAIKGKNGTVEVLEDRIVRTRKKLVGKDDVQTIPVKAVTAVSHDRKTLGTDEVKLTVGAVALAEARARWTDTLGGVSDHEGQFGERVGKPGGRRHVGPEIVEAPAEVLDEGVAGDDDPGGAVAL